MAIYNIDAEPITVVTDIAGVTLNQVYDIDAEPLIDWDHKPIKRYDYASDDDPDKSYQWTYDLQALQSMQGNCFTIGIQTDTHFLPGGTVYTKVHGADYATPLKNMTKRLYFDFIANFGDITRGWNGDTKANTELYLAEMMRRYTSYVESPVLVAIGNHDNANNDALHNNKGMAGVISKADLYTATIGKVKETTSITEPGGNAMYYYKDFDECRVIVLDTNDYPYLAVSDYDVHGNHHTISTTQVSWFENTALNTEKPVLVISHAPLVTDVSPSSLIVPTEDKQYSDNPMIPYRANEICAALSAFAQGGGDVIACFSGHIHRQRAATVDGIRHITFINGGKFAEIVFISMDNRTITTKVIGADKTAGPAGDIAVVDRSFTF